MKRIMIIGCSGSGKSTLALRLSEKTGIPVVHLDKLFWRSGWEHIKREEFDSLLKAETEKDEWIIDGDYSRTMKTRLEKADTVIYLDYKRITCLVGAVKRTLSMYGRTRPDMGKDCPERFDLDFYKFIWSFNSKNRQKYLDLLSEATDKEVYILHNRKESERFLDNIK